MPRVLEPAASKGRVLISPPLTIQVKRSEAGLDFGVILIPEGLIDFVPEVSQP